MQENYIEIEIEQCKGCRLCVETCPHHCIVQGSEINKMGYQYIRFVQNGCTACGFCYYICPEPGAITVIKAEKREAVHG
jgi:NAD-dependent dihydropyrimidine dehydrogenase PreA subunit